MSLSDHVRLVISAANLGVQRAGFGIPLILSVNATFPERARTYTDIAGVADDFPVTTSPEYRAANGLFAQNPAPSSIMIGRAIGQPTQVYTFSITSAAVGYTYGINVLGEGVTATECRYTALADLTITADNTTEIFTSVAHGMTTGDGPYRLTNSGGGLPAGTAVDTNYWIIEGADADTFLLAATKADAIAETNILITSDGTGTHTLARDNNDTIVAQLVQALNATVGKNFTAVHTAGAGETDTIVVTATAAGDWFSLEVTNVSLMAIAQTHAEPGTTLATDLNAINLENSTWYLLLTLYNSEAYVKAASAWMESVRKIYFADLSQSETVTLAAAGTGSSDAADDLKVLAYDRTATVYHPSPGAMLGARWAGTFLPYEPGEINAKFRQPAGVTPVTLTATHKTNLRAKNCNTLETIAGVNIMWEGEVCSGDFIDNVRDDDWVFDDMSKGVFEGLAFAKKIPFTDPGIALVVNQVEASLDRAVQKGIYAADPKPLVTAPKAASVSAANKTNRTLPDIKWSATRAGAVNKVDPITGVVSV